jgi:hypothetical protein
MIIVDWVDEHYVYTVVDKDRNTVLETANRSQAVRLDQEVNPQARSEFVTGIVRTRDQVDT